jgi:hypothetical protein
MWKRSYGEGTWAPPNERGGNRQTKPTATAPHLDSTYSVEKLLSEIWPEYQKALKSPHFERA